MKIVTIDKSLMLKYAGDPEILQKDNRPCVLIVRLKYKRKNQDFAVPLRSNIKASASKEQYFPLPPRPTTKSGNRHGLHYIKMFPVSKQYLVRYRTEGNVFSQMIKSILDKNEKRIVQESQRYLSRYEAGDRPLFSTDIDFLLTQLYK